MTSEVTFDVPPSHAAVFEIALRATKLLANGEWEKFFGLFSRVAWIHRSEFSFEKFVLSVLRATYPEDVEDVSHEHRVKKLPRFAVGGNGYPLAFSVDVFCYPSKRGFELSIQSQDGIDVFFFVLLVSENDKFAFDLNQISI